MVALGTSVFRVGTGFSLALAGAGYLVGIVAGIATLIGVAIAWGVAVPVLTARTVIPAGADIVAFATDIWSQQVRFIGAGTVAIGEMWTLVVLMTPMADRVRTSLAAVRQLGSGQGHTIRRAERDMPIHRPIHWPIHWVAGVTVLLAVPTAFVFGEFLSGMGNAPSGGLYWGMIAYAGVFAFLFAFLVAAAWGDMAGLVGSFASPISGIGIYLPPTIAVTLVLGAVLGWVIDRCLYKRSGGASSEAAATTERPRRRGVLIASGFIVAESPVGVLIAAIIGASGNQAPLAPVLSRSRPGSASRPSWLCALPSSGARLVHPPVDIGSCGHAAGARPAPRRLSGRTIFMRAHCQCAWPTARCKTGWPPVVAAAACLDGGVAATG